jgi:hypothetical protein
MKARLEHIIALLGALALTALPVWTDPTQTFTGQLATTAAAGFFVFVSTATLASARNAILGGLAVACMILAAIKGHFTLTTGGSAVIGMALAVITQLRTILSGQLPLPPVAIKTLIALFVAGGALLAPARARAQTVVPTDVAPPLSFCIGTSTTCVVEDLGLTAVNYDAVNKKWSGTSGAGFGYVLLFKADTPYASGFSVHATFNFSQSGPSFLAPTFAAVVFHWLEAGYTPVFYDGSIGHQITLMVALNAEEVTSLVTGKRIGARMAARRLELARLAAESAAGN